MVTETNVTLSAKTQIWCVVMIVIVAMVTEVVTLNGPNVCMVKQKYNITKRVKYRAPMSVRTYEWCMSIPPRCSKWSTEMRDLTRLETEERTAEVAVCCPGYKMKDVSCIPICPNGKTGHGCSQDCPRNKWGPNCVNDCKSCSDHGTCSPVDGQCSCHDGWQGESCDNRMSSSTSTTTTTSATVEELLTKKPATKPTLPSPAISSATRTTIVENTSMPTTSIITTAASRFQEPTSEISSHRTTHLPGTTIPLLTAVETISSSKKQANLESNEPTSTPKTLSETTTRTSTILTATAAPGEKTTTSAPVSITKVQKPLDTIPKQSTKTVIFESASTEYEPINSTNKEKPYDKYVTTESYNATAIYNNATIATTLIYVFAPLQKTTDIDENKFARTDLPHKNKYQPKEVHVEIKTTPIRIIKASDVTNSTLQQKTTALSVFTEAPLVSTHATTTTEGTTKLETTRRPDATIRYFPTTVKFKPKEIWIRPAQKGQESFAVTKKINHELHTKHRFSTNKEFTPNTTPKTIIVSIIPTSVSYSTFKKIALNSLSVLPQTANVTAKLQNNTAGQGFTKPMSVLTTSAPLTSTISTLRTSTVAYATRTSTTKSVNSSKSELLPKIIKTLTTSSNLGSVLNNRTISPNGTNSMSTDTKLNFSSIKPTISSTNFLKTTHILSTATVKHLQRVTNTPTVKSVTTQSRNVSILEKNVTNQKSKAVKDKTNATKVKDIAYTNIMTTKAPDDEETFHILTEPEHITAVMDGKGKEKTSVDLISVVSIAGGIMMAVITVAVIIVMIERCRRPRYEDVRKMNDIHMQVMIDNNDVPPPYVRSIFHTPLPDPPTSEKCHYQPLSTLDRNLKQFMRPVVVQTISPIMLENFREILECHYDHLPKRSHDFEVRHKHCLITPSSEDDDELTHLRPCSIAESTIDALKCEAKLDVLDSTTSEPLYAEIPCWRPPSEHAIEVMNYNGEAVTEL